MSDRPSRWEIVHDAETGTAGIEAADWSAFEFPEEGLRCEEGHVYSTGVRDDDPLSARVEGRTRFGLRRPGAGRRGARRADGSRAPSRSSWSSSTSRSPATASRSTRRSWRERIPRNGG